MLSDLSLTVLVLHVTHSRNEAGQLLLLAKSAHQQEVQGSFHHLPTAFSVIFFTVLHAARPVQSEGTPVHATRVVLEVPLNRT